MEIQKRVMIGIETGKNYHLRRRLPKITYQTLETGAMGPGDRAQATDKTGSV